LMKTNAVFLKKGREKSLHRKHQWIFSGAVHKISGSPVNGENVDILTHDGQKIGVGSLSMKSQIMVRVWSFDPHELINDEFFFHRFSRALQLRGVLEVPRKSNAFRLVNAESDGLPGLIVDQYQNFLVCQFLSAGTEFHKEAIVNQLIRVYQPDGIYERSDSDARLKEGLQKRCDTLYGALPDGLIKITEHGIHYMVDMIKGHKTGFYLDQRDNRLILGNLSQDRDILNCFSYTGGFGLSAMAGGANSVTNIDVSEGAMDLSIQNALLNGFDVSKVTGITGDVFQHLRNFRDLGSKFDLVILDPPKFAASASQLAKAARGYKDINLLAMKILKPGGLLFTFSCSGHMTPELFRKIISDAATDAGCGVYFEKNLQQSTDHPVLASFPESFYLKGYICRVWNS
jgi:23S rRNA (cytosine1962-C5)-methyltransferase